jgi:hypothetical protein
MNSKEIAAKKIEEMLATGNIEQFAPEQKVSYINMICESLGLNPLTRPFEFVKFQGKTVLYARKDCTDQLRKIHGVSIEITEQKTFNDILFVTVIATDRHGRTDSDVGALPISNLKGNDLANATMKAVTKAKRRVTLSICGLGLLDESELETMPGAKTEAVPFMREARSLEAPTKSAFDEIRALLVQKNKTEEGLLKFLATQSGEVKIERIEDLNQKQIESAITILGGNV